MAPVIFTRYSHAPYVYVSPKISPLILIATTTSSGSTNITLPSDIQSGDIILWSQHVANQTFGGTVPTGFTQIQLTTVVAVDNRTAYKIADGTEGGTTISGMTGSNYVTTVSVFRPNYPIYTITTGTWNSEGSTSGTVTAQTIVPPSNTGPVIIYAFGSERAGSPNTDFTSQSPTFNTTIKVNDGSGDASVVGFTIYQNSSTANTHTVDYDVGGTRIALMSGYILLT